MSAKYPQQAVIVSEEAAASSEPYDIIWSNLTFLHAQFEEHLREEEVSENSLRSYHVDNFRGEVDNGGFSQFVYNFEWGKGIDYLCEGFVEIGAVRHREQFENAMQRMSERLGLDGLRKFRASEYFGENEERDLLNEFNDQFRLLSESENLIELNVKWLRQLPDLVILSKAEMAEELHRRAEAIPDRQERIKQALAAEPRFMKLIRALCKTAGHSLDRVTIGKPFQFRGHQLCSWHFFTNEGRFHMAEVEGKAFMLRDRTDEVVCVIEATDEIAPE